MTALGYVAAAWAVVLGAVVVYALALLRRGRRLSGRVNPQRRRWMTTPTSQADGTGEADGTDGSARPAPGSEPSPTEA